MRQQLDYPAADVTKALMRLAANEGDVDRTADELVDDRFMVPADTLRHWKLETYREQYTRLEEQRAHELEQDAIAQLRRTIKKVGELEDKMLERVGGITDRNLTPNALRALSDARAKATNELLQLTGRPVNGQRAGGSPADLVMSMVELGYLRLAPGIDLEPRRVPNEAEVGEQAA